GFASHRDKEIFSGHGRAQAEKRYCVGDLTPKKQRVNPDTCSMPISSPRSFAKVFPLGRAHVTPGNLLHNAFLPPFSLLNIHLPMSRPPRGCPATRAHIAAQTILNTA
ncbi:MAG: hypothetical protein LCH26_08170, partial [Proteobacteria bacterium]|nr:hypothetical protein [Pseudomonadota bacterium]